MKEREREGIREEGISFDNLPTCLRRGNVIIDMWPEKWLDVSSRENSNSLAQNSSYRCTVKFEQEFVP